MNCWCFWSCLDWCIVLLCVCVWFGCLLVCVLVGLLGLFGWVGWWVCCVWLDSVGGCWGYLVSWLGGVCVGIVGLFIWIVWLMLLLILVWLCWLLCWFILWWLNWFCCCWGIVFWICVLLCVVLCLVLWWLLLLLECDDWVYGCGVFGICVLGVVCWCW